MKKHINLILATLFIVVLLAFTYRTTQATAAQPTENTQSSLEGTWKLVKAKWGDAKAHKVPEQEVYKIYTKDHFFFIYYDGATVSGAGGGTYALEDGSFTETLNYFSWHHSAAGTQQSFNYTLEADQLHQYGKIRNTDQYDEYVIDEYYERVEPGISTAGNNSLAGVWEYTNGKGNTSEYIAENGMKVLKVVTPNHWYVVYTEKATGKYHGVGFGTYILYGNSYSEHITAFSFDSTAVGKTFDYTIGLREDQWRQQGKIDTEQYPDFTVEEVYRRVE